MLVTLEIADAASDVHFGEDRTKVGLAVDIGEQALLPIIKHSLAERAPKFPVRLFPVRWLCESAGEAAVAGSTRKR